MLTWKRMFVCLLVIAVAPSVGSLAYACVAEDGGDPPSKDFPAVPAENEDTGTFALTGTCYWAPTGVNYLQAGDPWITILAYDWTWPAGLGHVTYKVDPNLGPDPRDAEIVVEGVVVHKVHQAANCHVEYLDAPSGAGSVFVTNTVCGRVIEFSKTAYPDWQPAVYEDSSSSYEGAVHGPDGQLYVCDPSQEKIWVIDPLTSSKTEITARDLSGQPASPQCALFTPDGSLIVTDTMGAGIYVFPNDPQYPNNPPNLGEIDLGTPELIDGSEGALYQGLTVAANGDLLVVDSTNMSVKKLAYNPTDQSYGAPTTLIPGPVNSLGIARASNGDIFVGSGGSLNRYDSDGEGIALCYSFGSAVIKFIKAAGAGASPTENYESLYVATVEGDVGTLWEIPFYYEDGLGEDDTSWACGGEPPIPIATLTGKQSEILPPLTGVAVPFTQRDGKLMATNPDPVPADSELFNFFDSLYEFRPQYADDFTGECTFHTTAKQVSAGWLQQLINDHPLTVGIGAPIIFDGDNGRGLIFDYDVVEPQCKESNNIVGIQHSVNAYFAGVTSPTPVVCSGDETAAYGCYATTFLSGSSIGFLPLDGRISGGGGGDFSFVFLMDRFDAENSYDGFCGFKSPLDVASETDPLIVNPGSTIPIGFTVREKNGNCKQGPFVDGVTAVLSVTRISPDLKFYDADELSIVGGGSSEDGRVVFNVPVSAKKGYEIQFKAELADGTPFPSGAVFELTVTDDSGLYFPTKRAYIQTSD